jgi:hypothetical protein
MASFFKDKKKVKKKSQNSRNQGFSFYFCLMIEGSRRPKTCGSGRSGSGFGSATLLYRHTQYKKVLAALSVLGVPVF